MSTGAALLGFASGWAALRVLSARTNRPQPWAAVPAVAMAATGLALIAFAPSDDTLGVLTWVWPPVAAGSSRGVSKVCEPAGLRPALEAALALDSRALVEDALRGKEFIARL